MESQPFQSKRSERSQQDLTPGNVLLVLPCFNEGESIHQLLSEIQALKSPYDTLVVDDGSSDDTYRIARDSGSKVIRLIQNLGIGGAVQTGIKFAWQHDYDFCIQVDGDGQHPPDQITVLLEACLSDSANIVVGSRYLKNDTFRSTAMRRAGGRFISQMLVLLFGGTRISDPTSGLRLLDRKAIALFSAHYPLDYPEPISLAWALRAGLKISERPVSMRAREKGQSSIFGVKIVSYMIRVIGYLLLARIMPRGLGKGEA
jgi:glycosyltransferase involved in cell wall biosynthesis